jgi:hypothetical protein
MKVASLTLWLLCVCVRRFHVDDHSSAHVYLRMRPGMTLDDISPEVLEDCAQLTKANSIEGCKLKSVSIVYTFWSNLKKTMSMDVGQVGFHDEKDRRFITVEKKSPIVKRLEKTRVEKFPDLEGLRIKRDKKMKEKRKKEFLQAVCPPPSSPLRYIFMDTDHRWN